MLLVVGVGVGTIVAVAVLGPVRGACGGAAAAGVDLLDLGEPPRPRGDPSEQRSIRAMDNSSSRNGKEVLRTSGEKPGYGGAGRGIRGTYASVRGGSSRAGGKRGAFACTRGDRLATLEAKERRSQGLCGEGGRSMGA